MSNLNELQQKIIKLKKENGFLIAAHSYQSPEILEIADLVGDSFALSVKVKDYSEKNVILCGVKFMADTVKILSPEKNVVLPCQSATCPMAEQIKPETIIKYRKENPTHKVVAYVNTTTELKAVCDVCVTSSVAQAVVSKLDCDEILFIPDKNLGAYIAKMVPSKKVHLVDGYCPVHNIVNEDDVKQARKMYPNALLLAHPECPEEVLNHADFVGSTSAIIDYVKKTDKDCIIGTEKTIADYLSIIFPERNFPVLTKKLICPDMRLTTLMDVYKALNGGGEVIEIDEETRIAAKKSIDEMIRLGE